MAIATAVQRGQQVYVYDEKGRLLTSIPVVSSRPEDGLRGFTGSTVSIQRGKQLYLYNEKGGLISSIPV